MNGELDFWAGLVIGFVAAMNVGVVVLGLAHARNELNREKARKAQALIAERMQASLYVPHPDIAKSIREATQAAELTRYLDQWGPGPDPRAEKSLAEVMGQRPEDWPKHLAWPPTLHIPPTPDERRASMKVVS